MVALQLTTVRSFIYYEAQTTKSPGEKMAERNLFL